MSTIADRMPVIDTDSHVSEPPDLWTSRLPRRWADLAPRIVHTDKWYGDLWVVGDRPLVPAWATAPVGWKEHWPSYPRVQSEVDPAAYDPVSRAQRLDEFGIHAQVLYPNIVGFNLRTILAVGERDFHLACIRAQNDFFGDFAAAAPGRFIPTIAVPFFDLDESIREIERCAGLGHKGILFANAPEKAGFPPLRDAHWHPLLRTAEEAQLSVNFHIGFGEFEPTTARGTDQGASDEQRRAASLVSNTDRSDFVKASVLAIQSNAEAIVELIVSGLCHRYPTLSFVSVESGFGYVPYLLEALDWQWLNGGAEVAYPDRLKPSDYFRRQIYTSFWFERESLSRLVDLYPDNVMFETDFPHPTCLAPGPASHTDSARRVIDANLADLPDATLRKLLYETAARVYHLDAELLSVPVEPSVETQSDP